MHDQQVPLVVSAPVNGNLLSERDGLGNRSSHAYNALNQRTGSTLAGNRHLVSVPDVFGNVLEVTDARGHKTIYRYDQLNRVTRVVYADGGVADTVYDGAGNKTSQTDARGNATTYKPDALNRVESTQDPEGGRTAATYDLVGNVLTETDKRGTQTEHTYDKLNRRTSTRKAGIELEALSYTAIGKVASRTDANGNRTTYTYDRRGLQTGTSAPEGATTAQVLDGMGDATQQTDGEGRVTRTAYDVRRRQVEVTNPAGEVTKNEYDRNNNRTATVRPAGGRTIFAYDSRNWLESVTEPMGRTSRYTRDANGNLTGFTDGANRSIVFDHDKMNRRTTVTYAGGATQSNVYDVAGNVVQHIDANGVSVGRVFDKLNRERSETYSASSDGLTGIETVYDPNGNVLTVTEKYGADSRTTTKTYDGFDRELTVLDGFGAQIAYTYDPNGNRKTLATQDAKVTRYGYDGLNRLTGLGSAAGSTQYLYDRSGLVREQVNGNGTVTSTTYDAAQRPKRIALAKGGVVLNLTEYSYDPNGNRTQERVNRPGGAQVTSYGYDAADRLSSTKRVDGANTVDSSWTYDGADNRLSETVVSTGAGAGTVTRAYTYDARNQLREIVDSVAGTTTLSYDPQGNLQQKVRGNDTTAYVWSARDLLASVSRNGTVLGRYGSDHAGLRVQKEALDPLQPGAPPRVLRTQWDDENAVQDRDTGGTVIARYDFAGGQPVAMWSAEDGNQVLHADALGSVVATTAADGSLKSETLYDAWGNPVVKAGASANKFAYTGHQADAETGLYYFKARYYDPETGRFISVDPAEGQDGKPASYHKYLYAYANPLVYVDLDGYYARDAEEVQRFMDAKANCRKTGDCVQQENFRQSFSDRDAGLRHCKSLADCRAKVQDAERGFASMNERLKEIWELQKEGNKIDPHSGRSLQEEYENQFNFLNQANGEAFTKGVWNSIGHARLEGQELSTKEQIARGTGMMMAGGGVMPGMFRARITTEGRSSPKMQSQPATEQKSVPPSGAKSANDGHPGTKPEAAPKQVDLQRATDRIHAELPEGPARDKSVTTVTVSSQGNVVVSRTGGVPTPAQREKAEEIFGKGNVEFVWGGKKANAEGDAGHHAEARGGKYLGDAARGAQQASSHYSCDQCAGRQAKAGIQNVTGNAADHGGKITRPLTEPDKK